MNIIVKLIFVTLFVSACAADHELIAHLEAERDFHAHQKYLEGLYEKYNPNQVPECAYIDGLDCEKYK